MKSNIVVKELRKIKNPVKAEILSRFFKTGKGEYGYGDVFLGITVPLQREVAKKYKSLSLIEIKNLLQNKIHECRLTALLILIEQYKDAEEKEKEKIAKLYLSQKKQINNWDLVDLSAPSILGEYFFEKKKNILYKMAKSKDLWEKRIAIVSTFYFIRKEKYEDTIRIAEILLKDKEDLIHKAVGWMLREVGKRSIETEEIFLKKYAINMPRTMLRYAIERFPEEKRKEYLKIKPKK
jgi:3-methyladenine DNA glycosylase AlkD